MRGGYIRLDRKILDWEWYGDINTTRLFIHFLLTAQWEDSTFRGVPVPRGSLVTSYPLIEKQTGLSIQQARTALSNIQSTGSVTVRRYPKFSVISVVSYDEYQIGNRQSNSQSTGNQQAEQQAINNIKEEKNKESNNISLNYPTRARGALPEKGEEKGKNVENSSEAACRYGLEENVLLTEKQYRDMKAIYPETWEDTVDRLSAYILDTGKYSTYKNHLVVLMTWAEEDAKKGRNI